MESGSITLWRWSLHLLHSSLRIYPWLRTRMAPIGICGSHRQPDRAVVAEVEPDELGEPKPRGIEQLYNGATADEVAACRPGSLNETCHLIDIQYLRSGRRDFGALTSRAQAYFSTPSRIRNFWNVRTAESSRCTLAGARPRACERAAKALTCPTSRADHSSTPERSQNATSEARSSR